MSSISTEKCRSENSTTLSNFDWTDQRDLFFAKAIFDAFWGAKINDNIISLLSFKSYISITFALLAVAFHRCLNFSSLNESLILIAKWLSIDTWKFNKRLSIESYSLETLSFIYESKDHLPPVVCKYMMLADNCRHMMFAFPLDNWKKIFH